MIDNLTGLNFTLTGMFVLFIAGHILSTILFVKKKKKKKKKSPIKYIWPQFPGLVCTSNSSDSSTIIFISIVLYWKIPNIFQALIEIENK